MTVSVPNERVACRPPTSSQLSVISLSPMVNSWAMCYTWSWPHPEYDLTIGGFPGIFPRDVEATARAVQQLSKVVPHWGTFYVDASYWPGRWIAWYWSERTVVHVEFHTSVMDSDDDGRAKSHIVLEVVLRLDVRVVRACLDPKSGSSVKRMDEYLAQLPHLGTVIVETAAITDARPLQERFALTGHKLRFRTLEESRKMAALAREGRDISGAEDRVVSPFWYLLRHKYQWEYWLT